MVFWILHHAIYHLPSPPTILLLHSLSNQSNGMASFSFWTWKLKMSITEGFTSKCWALRKSVRSTQWRSTWRGRLGSVWPRSATIPYLLKLQKTTWMLEEWWLAMPCWRKYAFQWLTILTNFNSLYRWPLPQWQRGLESEPMLAFASFHKPIQCDQYHYQRHLETESSECFFFLQKYCFEINTILQIFNKSMGCLLLQKLFT